MLVVTNGKNTGKEFPLSGDTALIGSAPECTIQLDDVGVNEKHAVLEKERGVWFLRSVDAAVPIEIEGRILTEMRVDHDSTFRVGVVQLRFVTPHAIIEATPASGETFDDQESAVAPKWSGENHRPATRRDDVGRRPGLDRDPFGFRTPANGSTEPVLDPTGRRQRG